MEPVRGETHSSWSDFPHLFQQLDFEKNLHLTHRGTPVEVHELSAGTNKKLDWKCDICYHEWKATGSNRTVLGRGCPACINQEIHIDGRNSMAKTHPELAEEFQGDATQVIAGTHRQLDWKCSTCEHEWRAMGSNRAKPNSAGCPVCYKNTLHSDGRNSMALTHPDLAMEYQGDAELLRVGTNRKLPWKCITCSHEWKASGSSRAKGIGCPACSNKAIHVDGRNSMAETHPELAEELQGDATQVIAGTHRQLDWRCSTCKHEWSTQGYNRVNGTGCPACDGKEIHIDGRNSMAKTHPDLALDYVSDPTKIIAGTHRKLDWMCSTCSHRWEAVGSSRCNGRGCPACSNKAVHTDGRNSMAATHPELAEEYLGDSNKVIANTHVRLKWKCKNCNHEWIARGDSRCSGSGCSNCANRGFNSALPGFYYVHKILNEHGDILYYKAGISNDWEKRKTSLAIGLPPNLYLENLEYLRCEQGSDVRLLETKLLRVNEIRAPARDFDGGHELFLYNPLDYAREQGWLVNNSLTLFSE